jgi:Skp family chaperone for outer membrane proteins
MSIAPLFRSLLPAAAAVALYGSLAAQVPQPASASKAGLGERMVVGVIDVVKAVEQYPRYIKLRNELDASVKQYEVELKGIAERIDELRGTIQILAEGAPERADKEFEYQMLLQTQDYRRKAYTARVGQRDLRNTLTVYEDLEYVIGVVARRKGVALVLTKQDITPSSQPITEISGEEVKARVQAYDRRQVWFASEELDLTSAVIKELMIPVPDRNSPERAPKTPPNGKE